jgi:hypothetical protein
MMMFIYLSPYTFDLIHFIWLLLYVKNSLKYCPQSSDDDDDESINEPISFLFFEFYEEL